jgi:aryl-alcohol dehydrogenase-like predicted oxidoreductase
VVAGSAGRRSRPEGSRALPHARRHRNGGVDPLSGHDDLRRGHLTRALDASLRRLGVEAVDLYQAHAWDPLTPLPETLRFFDDAVGAGKIHNAGVSNFTGWQLQKAALFTRLGEDSERGVEAYAGRNAQERTWRVLDAVRQVAQGRGVSMSAVSLAWLADRPAVTSVILGARTIAQLDDNLTAADLTLTAEETQLLDEASAPPVADYPYGGPGVRQRGRELPTG